MQFSENGLKPYSKLLKESNNVKEFIQISKNAQFISILIIKGKCWKQPKCPTLGIKYMYTNKILDMKNHIVKDSFFYAFIFQIFL